MASIASQEPRASEVRHRRETLLLVILPLLLVLLLIIACVVGVLLLPRRDQVSIVSDVMFTLLMLCPAVVCILPVTIGVIAAVFAMNRAHDKAAGPLRRLEDLSLKLAQRADSSTDTINRRTIDFSARLGFLYRWMSVLEGDEDEHD